MTARCVHCGETAEMHSRPSGYCRLRDAGEPELRQFEAAPPEPRTFTEEQMRAQFLLGGAQALNSVPIGLRESGVPLTPQQEKILAVFRDVMREMVRVDHPDFEEWPR